MLAGQMLVIIIRLLYDFQYIYICEVFVLFSRIYSSRVVSLSLCKSDYLRLVLFWFVFAIQKIRESIKNVELYETEYSFFED